MTRRVGLLGGSFDPVHCGHLALANAVKKSLCLDVVYLVVAAQSPFKDSAGASFAHRYAMCMLAADTVDGLAVSDMEEHMPRPSYTYDTICQWKKANPLDALFFIIGADQANQLSKWHHIKELQALVHFVVADRDEAIVSPYPYTHLSFQHPASSSVVRSGSFCFLQPPVRDYIFQHRLYLDALVCSLMSKKRFQHTLEVIKVGMTLANAWQLDNQKVMLSCLLHDIAKEFSQDVMMSYMAKENAQTLAAPKAWYHQFVGARYVQEVLLLQDTCVLTAIRNHSTGGSDPYSMVIYIADKIEPGRGYDASEEMTLSLRNLQDGYELTKQRATAHYRKGQQT